MSLTQQDLPGAYTEFPMHAGADETLLVTLYSAYDEVTNTGTPIDLTGATFKARGIDDDGIEVWSVVPTSPTPSNGEIYVIVPAATTLLGVNTSGDWGLQVTWPGGEKTIEAYGPFLIGKELVD